MSKIALALVSCFLAGVTEAQDELFINTSTAELIKLSATTCQHTLIGTTSTPLQDIALTPSGRLWGVYGNSLYEIDTSDASLTFVGTMTGLSTNSLVAWNNDTLIGDYYGWLWGIRTSDGYAWQIDSIAVGSSGDLTWYDGDLYMTTFVPDLVKLSVNANLTEVTSVVHVGNLEGSWGGGWLGANTIITEGDCGPRPQLVTCVGPNVLGVSAETAAVDPICTVAMSGVSWGAASCVELPEVVLPANTYSMPNVFSPNGDGVNDLFIPWNSGPTVLWSLQVYDRWGRLLGEFKDRGWNGKDDSGNECPEGTYFIIVSPTSSCSDAAVVHRTITLVR